MSALAKRAVAAGWRWLAGAADHECRVVRVEDDGSLHTVTFHGGMDDWHGPGAMSPPDLDDPATLGCLLALVREAWGAPNAHPTRTVRGAATAEHRGSRPEHAVDSAGGGWHVLKWCINRGNGGYHDIIGGHHHDLIEALVAALEAAP